MCNVIAKWMFFSPTVCCLSFRETGKRIFWTGTWRVFWLPVAWWCKQGKKYNVQWAYWISLILKLSESSNPLMQHLFSHRQGKLVKQACWLDEQNALLLETRWKVKKVAIPLFGDNFSITTWCVYFNAQGHFSHVTATRSAMRRFWSLHASLTSLDMNVLLSIWAGRKNWFT